MNLIQRFLKKLFHVHYFKPILSSYVSFNVRNIVYECPKCKARMIEKIKKSFSEPFPIETSGCFSEKELQDVMNKGIEGLSEINRIFYEIKIRKSDK